MGNDAVALELVASRSANPEDYVEVRLLDLSVVRWEGSTASDRDAAKAIVTDADGVVLVKGKHVAKAPVVAAPVGSHYSKQVTVKNADDRFQDVKCFATLEDAARGVFKASLLNGVLLELFGAVPEDAEAYVQIRSEDAIVGLSWVKLKHLCGVGQGRRNATCGVGQGRATARAQCCLPGPVCREYAFFF